MIKKSLLTLAIALTSVATALAIPANRRPMTVTQPDGTQLTLQLAGDEWNHYYRTTDGYTLAKDSRGYYTYARLNSARQLVPSTLVAHDEAQRSQKEKAFLAGTQRHLTPAMTAEAQAMRNDALQAQQRALMETQARSAARRALMQQQRNGSRKAPIYDYNNFRGLIILVEYNDLGYSISDYDSIFNEMVNQKGYTGYTDSLGQKQTYVGSVHDYFSDNSGGVFQPVFDVVGPIKLDYSQYYPQGTRNARAMFLKAVQAADSLVDYSLYDGDNNGEIDMIFFMVPGYSASYSGNDESLLWPHMSALYTRTKFDGKKVGRYACSTEMYGYSQHAGNPNLSCIDGIGTICHEFSHVLGIMDHYDTDYEENGESFHPGDWDIMASGGDGDRGRQPVGYSLYEKVAMGFTEPATVTHGDTISLALLDTLHSGLRIPSGEDKEVFYLENRQQTAKWGNSLPGHGLLVWRIDSTKTSVYTGNVLNADPEHNYIQIVRAKPLSHNSGADTYPGTRGVTMLCNDTDPGNLLSWTKKPCTFELEDISEDADGTLHFIIYDLRDPRPATAIILPNDSITIGVGCFWQLVPEVLPAKHTSTVSWATNNNMVATVDANGVVMGLRPGTCYVIATTDSQVSDSCKVIVEEETLLNTVADFLALDDGTAVRLKLNAAQVLFQANNGDIYMRDGTGAVVMKGTGLSAEVGDVLGGSIYCQRNTATNGMPLLQLVENRSRLADIVVSQGETPQPLRIKLEDLGTQHLGQYVDVWGYHVEEKVKVGSVSRTCLYKQMNEETRVFMPVYNNFALPKSQITNADVLEDHYYAAVGIVWPYTRDNDLNVSYELSLTEGFRDITDDPEWTAGITTVKTDRNHNARIYDLRGVQQQQLQRGVNIVRTQDGQVIKTVKK